ncbi:MAG TPA: hypothetical protein VKV80_11575 [Streptosporangiaceae bacterium]|nr:hypothetical protein [Streptosporangiaceae bacterium]
MTGAMVAVSLVIVVFFAVGAVFGAVCVVAMARRRAGWPASPGGRPDGPEDAPPAPPSARCGARRSTGRDPGPRGPGSRPAGA